MRALEWGSFAGALALSSALLTSACGVSAMRETTWGAASEVAGRRSFAVAVSDNDGKEVSTTDDKITEWIGQIVVKQAERRGFVRAPMQSAQFVISVDVVIKGIAEFRKYDGSSFRGTGMQSSMNTRTYEEGMLMFDFIDVREKRVLWRTSVRARVSEQGADEELNALVSLVLDDIAPPQPASVPTPTLPRTP